MADISFYKYLEAAFRYKLFKDTKAASFNYLGYNLPYETMGAKKGIFEYARKVLPSFYGLHFPDTEEGHLQMARDFLQKLDLRLDPELSKYFDPATTPVEYEQTISEAKQQSQAEGGPAPAEGTGAAVGMPGLPSGPSISSMPRRIYRTPPTPEKPKPDIAIANKSGVVTEAGDSSKLVKASSSGQVVEKPPSKIFVADKGGVREHVIKPSSRFRFPSAFANFGKNMASKAGVFIKRNLTPMRLGTLVSGGIGAIAGAGFGLPGMAVGGLGGAALPTAVRSGAAGRFMGNVGRGAINAGARLSNQASRISVPSPGKKWALALLGIFLFIGVVGFMAAPPTQTQPPPSAIIPPPLDYTLPLRDTSVVPQDIRDYISQRWPNAQIDNWQIIIDQAIAHGWNPAVLLTLWMEESGAQGKEVYDDPLGCDVSVPTQDIQVSLGCFFRSYDDQFSNEQFQQFMITYSAPNDPYPFFSNPNFPKTFKEFYDMLVPPGTYGATEPIITPPPPGVAASCPIPGGVIKTPSYQADPTTGHCSPSYGSCPPESRRAKAIDVDTRGENVIFPTIDGQDVDWYYLNQFSLNKPTDCEGGRSDCGIGAIFQARAGSTMWTLHLLHLDPWTTVFNVADRNRSRTAAGKTVSGVYVHINIGSSIQNASSPPQGDRDFNPGWISADFMCP